MGKQDMSCRFREMCMDEWQMVDIVRGKFGDCLV